MAARIQSFRLTEKIVKSYRCSYDQRGTVAFCDRISESQVSIAGVPWPTYKLIALAVGLSVLVGVGIATASAAPAVLSAAASTTVVWIILGSMSWLN